MRLENVELTIRMQSLGIERSRRLSEEVKEKTAAFQERVQQQTGPVNPKGKAGRINVVAQVADGSQELPALLTTGAVRLQL